MGALHIERLAQGKTIAGIHNGVVLNSTPETDAIVSMKNGLLTFANCPQCQITCASVPTVIVTLDSGSNHGWLL